MVITQTVVTNEGGVSAVQTMRYSEVDVAEKELRQESSNEFQRLHCYVQEDFSEKVRFDTVFPLRCTFFRNRCQHLGRESVRGRGFVYPAMTTCERRQRTKHEQAQTHCYVISMATAICILNGRTKNRRVPAIDGVTVVVRHAVQQRDVLVGVHGDENVPCVRVDVVVRETFVQQAQQRCLVEAVELRGILQYGARETTVRGGIPTLVNEVCFSHRYVQASSSC